MAKDRARDDRRSVGSHEKMIGALGKAVGYRRATMDLGEHDKRTGKTLAMGYVPRGSGEGYFTDVFEPGAGHVRTGHKVEIEPGQSYFKED